MHRPGAPLDITRHATSLPFQMEAQTETVQMPEDPQRDAARRPLRRLGKYQLTQLRENGSRQPEQAIGQQQTHRHHQHRLGAARSNVHRVHQLFQEQRNADVCQLRPHHQQQRNQHAPSVLPEIGQQALEGIPVITLDRLSRITFHISPSRHSPHPRYSFAFSITN